MQRRIAGVRWIVLALIVVASGVSYLLRTNLSVLGETIRSDLELSEIEIGIVFSAFAAGYALFQIPGGLFGDRLGSRHALAIIAVLWGVLTIVTGLVPSGWSVATILAFLVVTRFLVGAVHAPIFPIASGRTIALWFPVGRWGLPNGLISTGLTLGAAATGPIMVWLVEEFGWRWSLFLTAPAAFLVAAVWWLFMRDKPTEHSWVTDEENALIAAGRKPPTEGKLDWRRVLANREILLLAFSYFCMNYVFYLFFNWFFYFLVEVRGYAAQEAGVLMAALWIIGAVGATAGGYLCDYLIARIGLRWGPASLAIAALGASGVLLVAGALSQDAMLAVVLLCLCFGCNQITEAAYWSTAIAVSGDRAAEGTGVMNTGGNIVGLLGGVMVPFIAAQTNWTVAICSGAVFALIGAVTWVFVRGDRSI